MTDTVYATERHADRAAVVSVLTAAFQEDPVVSWLFPDPGERRRLQPHYYNALLQQRRASADLIAGGDGAAVWLELTAGEVLGALLAERHPHHEPHLYLACMGVRPGHRGAGLGSALLAHRLRRTELPAYLEASSPQSRDLYLRHGFQDLGEPVHLPAGPSLWPMWRTRTPQATQQATQ